MKDKGNKQQPEIWKYQRIAEGGFLGRTKLTY